MGVLLNYPKFSASNDSGTALVGGELYTYIAGTTTNKATYSDYNLATANANPVVLDRRGEATVYGAGAYKFVLKDSAGNTVWSVDNLTLATGQGDYAFYPNPGEADQNAVSTGGSITDILTALGTSKKATVILYHNGAANTTTYTVASNADWSAYTNVTFKIVPGAVISHGAFTVNIPNLDAGLYQVFSGTGAVTLSGNVKEVFPEWWGIDGVADEVQINAAINSLPIPPYAPWFPTGVIDATHAQTWAGTVRLTGFYNISNSINTFSGVRLKGSGMHTTQIYNSYTLSRRDAIAVVGTRASQADYHTTIEDMTITGNALSGHGIYVKDVMYPRFRNLIVQLHGDNGIYFRTNDAAFPPGQQVGAYIEDCEIYANQRWGVMWGDETYDTDAGTILRIRGSSIRSNGADVSQLYPTGGIRVWNILGPDLYGNNIEGNFGVGLRISSTNGSYTNNYFEANGGGSKTITNITKANPAVVTYTASGYDFVDGEYISIESVGGMTEVNNKAFQIDNVNTTAHTFELVGINSSGYTDYTTGGIASGENVRMTKDGIGVCTGNVLVGNYFTYGSLVLDDTATENVIIGTHLADINPNLIIGAASLNNQLVATRSLVPVRQDQNAVNIYRNDKTIMSTATLSATTVTGGVGGVSGSFFYSLEGITASTASTVPVTIFTATVRTSYLVTAWVEGGGATLQASATVVVDNTTASLLNNANGGAISISLSGLNVQLTQTSGGPLAMTYRVLRIGS